MMPSRSRRWWMYRIADFIGVLIGLMLSVILHPDVVFSELFNESFTVLKTLVVSWLFFVGGWYILSFYYPLTLLVRIYYSGTQIPTLKKRFLCEIGVFIIHSIVAAFVWYYFDVVNFFTAYIFWVGWPCVLMANLYVFYILEDKDIRFNKT